jgi:curved DNA-binding protein CbpA
VIFKLVTAANTTLSDPPKRAEYDRRRTLGAYATPGGGSSFGSGAASGGAAHHAHGHGHSHARPFGGGAAGAGAGAGAGGGARGWAYNNPWRYAAGAGGPGACGAP